MREFSDADVGLTAPAGAGPREFSDAEVFGPPKRDVGVLESAGRGFMHRAAQGGQMINLAASLPAVVLDAVHSLASGRTQTGLQDYMFRESVDPSANAAEHWRIKPETEQQTIASKVAGGVGSLGVDLPLMIATGGGSAAPRVGASVGEIILPAIKQTSRAMAVPATTSATDKAKQLQERGVDVPTATAAAINTGLNTVAGGVLPLNAPGGVVKRIVQGMGVGPVQGEVERNLENAILGERHAAHGRQFDPEEALVQALTTAIIAGAIGPRPQRPPVSRAEMGYDRPEPPRVPDWAWQRYGPILEANGITDPADPRALAAVERVEASEARRAALRPGQGEDPDVAKAAERIAAGEQHPATAPWVGRQAVEQPATVAVNSRGEAIPLDAEGRPQQPGHVAGKMENDIAARYAAEVEAQRAFEVAQAQARRKQQAQDEAAIDGQPRDLREARAGGTTSREGSAATAPQQFAFMDVKRQGGRVVSTGPEVEIRGETTMRDAKGNDIPAYHVEYTRELPDGGRERVFGTVAAARVSTLERPAAPRFAQDIKDTIYEPPPAVGRGEQQPQPRAAGQRITTTPSPEFIKGSGSQRPGPLPSRAPRRAPEDITDLAFERIEGREPPAAKVEPKQLEAPLRAKVDDTENTPDVVPQAPKQAVEPTASRPAEAADDTPAPAPVKRMEKGTGRKQLLNSIKKRGGLDPKEAREIYGDKVVQAQRAYPGVFRKGGLSEDYIVEWMQDQGWLLEHEVAHADDNLPGGSIELARDMIRRALDGDEYVTHPDRQGEMLDSMGQDQHDEHAARMREDPWYRGEVERREQEARDAAMREEGLAAEDADTVELVSKAAAKDADAVERAAIQYPDGGPDFIAEIRRIADGENTSEAAGQRGAAAEPRAQHDTGGREGDEGGRGELRQEDGGAQRNRSQEGEAGNPEFDLERPTEQQLRQRAGEQQRRAEHDRRVEQAPDPEGFTLTGSDRATDEAAARGQQELPGTKSDAGTLFSNPFHKAAEVIFGNSKTWKNAAREWEAAVESITKKRPGAGENGVAKFVRAAFDSYSASMRSTVEKNGNSATAKEVMDHFHQIAGEGRATGEVHSVAMRAQVGKRMVELDRILGERVNDKETMRQVVALVRNPKGIRPGTPIHDAADGIRKLLAETLKYMRDAGVKVGEVKDGYFPREFDVDAVMRDPKAFIDAVARAYRDNGMAPDVAVKAAKELHDGILYGETNSLYKAERGATAAPFLKGRVFGKDVDNESHPLNKFLLADPALSLGRYLERAVKRAEIARRFGDNFEKWHDWTDDKGKEHRGIAGKITDEGGGGALKELRDYVAAMSGIKHPGMSEAAMRVSSYLRTWGSLMFLEKATLSSLSEFIVPALRSGNVLDVGRSLSRTMADLFMKTHSMAAAERRAFAEDMGLAFGHISSALSSARFAGGDPVGRTESRVLDSFFKRTGLSQWTDATRVASADLGRIFVRRLAKEVEGGGGKLTKRHLAELGVPAEQAAAFAKYALSKNDGMPGAGDLTGPMGDLYRTAVRKFVSQSIMDPNAGTRPGWMNHPVGAIVGQLQSFNYAFYENVWKRNARLMKEAATGADYTALERAQMAMPTLMMPLLAGFAFAIGEARDAAFGDPERREKETGTEKAIKAASRGAPIAPLDPWLNIWTSARYNRSFAESAAGPVLGSFARAADAARDLFAKNSDKTNTTERRALRAVWDIFIEPSINLALHFSPFGMAANAAATQLAGAGQVKEKAFVEPLAGERKKQGAHGGKYF